MTRELINAAIAAEDALSLCTILDDVRRAAHQNLQIDEIFPEPLASHFKERARTLPCDPLAYILPMLACVASIVGTRVKLQSQGWIQRQTGNLWNKHDASVVNEERHPQRRIGTAHKA